MKPINQYVINFGGLSEGSHDFKFELEKNFFENFQYDEFNSCKINVKVKLTKKLNLLELEFFCKGLINLNCHVSNEPFEHVHNSSLNLVVKFGAVFNNDNEDLLILPKGSHQFDISQQLYEMIVLSLPLKIIHPGIIDGTLKSDTLTRLKSFEFSFKKDNMDPRWNKLKELK